jgi:S-adenosyl methyltransferase
MQGMADETTTDDDWAWVNDDAGWVPPSIDTTKPSVARMYDFFLGGKDNYPVDRETAAQFLTVFPDVAAAAQANREFLVRSVQAMATAGIDQFLDLGAGIPTSPNTHEVARQIHPGASVVYVDNDPIVTAHNRALLADDDRIVTVRADLRHPISVLDDPGVRAVLDLDRPIGLLMIAVLHFVDPSTGPLITSRFYGALSPGSQVAVTIGTRDGVSPEILAAGEKVYSRSNAPVHLRTMAQIQELLDGLRILPPGLEDVHRSEHARIVGARATKAALP